MIRHTLRDFMAKYGITQASVSTGHHVIALERMRDGIDPIPKRLDDYLTEWEKTK